MLQVQEWLAQASTVAAQDDRRAALLLFSMRPESNTKNLQELRVHADLAFTAGQWNEALDYYGLLSSANPTSYWPKFQIGRARQRMGDWRGAADSLRLATELSSSFAWAWYGLLRCGYELKEPQQVALAAVGFAGADRVKLNETHAKILGSAAHFLFENRLRYEPYELYRILIDCGMADNLVHLRHAEYFIWKRDFETALTLLEQLRVDKRLTDWGLRALAQTYAELDRKPEAAHLLSDLFQRNPKNFQFASDYLDVLIDLGDLQSARDVADLAAKSISSGQQQNLQVRLLTGIGDFQALLSLLSLNPELGPDNIRQPLDRAIAICVNKAKDFHSAGKLIDFRFRRFGYSDAVASAALNAAFATRDWEAARLWLSRVPHETFVSNTEFRIKRLEYHCFVGEMAEAERALSALEPLSELPARFQHSVLKCCAERGDWQRVSDLGVKLASNSTCSPETLYLILRAIRKTLGHRRAIAELDTAADQFPGSTRLRSVVLEELACLESSASGLSDPRLESRGAARQRLIFKRRIFGAHTDQLPKPFAIYYCTNLAYLGPSFVSLTSLAESNWELLQQTAIYLVVDDPEGCQLACRVATKLELHLEVAPIKVVSRDEVLDPRKTLKTSYGLFTGGQALAEAAYYRIFFARYLREQRKHCKALYIDSDTIVHGELSPLFEEEAPFPLRARLEVSRPEVAAAIRQHGLAPGQYFNSGILAFDLDHPGLDAALDKTIHAAEDRQAELIFQDQCALNIGFKDQFAALDVGYNYFITPNDPDPRPEGAILHFLDRPKPWDPMYNGRLCRLWFLHWSRLARIIGNEDAIRLYNLSNAG